MTKLPAGIRITTCSEENFRAIKHYIQAFELDDRGLQQDDFLVALLHGELAGFGRTRDYGHCAELCSLGVLEPQRLKGLGSALVEALSAAVKKPLFLVCIIPSFFEPLGFSICSGYPEELRQKLEYCTGHLPVEKAYVVMAKK